MGPRDCFRIPFRSTPLLSSVPISLSQSSRYCMKRPRNFSRNGQWKGCKIRELPVFIKKKFLLKKKNGNLRPVIDLSFSANQTNNHSRWRQSILYDDIGQRLDCLHRPDRCSPRSRKYLRFMFEGQLFQFTALPFGMSLSPWTSTKLMQRTCVPRR